MESFIILNSDSRIAYSVMLGSFVILEELRRQYR